MSSASRRESRKALVSTMSRAALMRTAATALIAASPFVYSGASAATTSSTAQLTAPTLKSGTQAKTPLLYSVSAGNFQLTAPIFQGGKLANLSLASNATLDSFKLNAPTLAGFSAATSFSAANKPVQNLLAVPMDAKAGPATVSASAFSITPMAAGTVTYDNSNDITVTDTETAIDVDGGTDSVVVNNTGDLIGGGGINVVTAPANITSSYSGSFDAQYTGQLYDAYNQGTGVYVNTGVVHNTYTTNYLDAAQSDATIDINNSGNIGFSGIYGIRAKNEAGAGIGIANSGDITATDDTYRRVGIYANTNAVGTTVDGPNVIIPGQYTYNSYGYLTGVISTGEHERSQTTNLGSNDVGSIRIENGGAIDMGLVDVSDMTPGTRPGYAVSEGIAAVGFGGVEVINNESGSIKVGDFSRGIAVTSSGDATIRNDGSIQVGNISQGIVSIAGNQSGSTDTYLHAGNTTIINTGDITGGLTKEEALASGNVNAFPSGIKLVEAIGISAYALGVSADYYGRWLKYIEVFQGYGSETKLNDLRGYLPSHPAPPPELTDPDEIEAWWQEWEETFVPTLKNLTTTIRNDGNIILKDGAMGIYGSAVYGDMRAYNSGTIALGDGASNFQGNNDFRATGINMNNFPTSGLANFYAKNEEGGIIVTGDDGAGILLRSAGGNAIAVNEGSITVGNGGLGDHTNGYAETYDWLFPSIGINVETAGTFYGQTAAATNSGDIHVGELAIGVQVIGRSATLVDPYRTTGFLENSGDVTGGNNSTGLIALGKTAVVANTGTVTIGSKDLSGFNLPADADSASSAHFGQLGYGIQAKSVYFGAVYNYGTVATGDNTIGIFNGTWASYGGYQIATIQDENGVVTTGDHSVGVRTEAHGQAILRNAGRISVGDYSYGVDMTAGRAYFDSGIIPDVGLVVLPGSVQAVNDGIIETGDNSVGVRLNGIRTMPYSGVGITYTGTPYPWSYDMTIYEGTVDVVGSAILENTGTIRVGANSTAVEITGYGYGHAVDDPATAENEAWGGINLYNVGTIDAGAGTAIKINADNDIGSMILNGGTIIGDVLLGAGDDDFLHGQNIDYATGQVLGTGNIIMNDNTIDFRGGENTFRIKRGVISVAGGDDNLITGDNLSVQMDYGEIDARNDFIVYPASPAAATLAAVPFADPSWFSTLTIDGDVSGNFRFAADVDGSGASDKLIINGDVASGSEIGVVINPVEQLKGEVVWRPITIGGANGADLVEVAGVSGLYADSVIDSEARYDAASGDIVISASFGLGHMGTAANAAAVSAGNWLAGTMSSYGHRNINAYTGRKGEGLAIWHYAFQDEGRINPDSDLQDLSFSQISTGMQAGVQWSQDIAGGRVSVSPMVTYGTVEANLRANTSSSRGHPWAVGLNANYVMDGGLYVDATYQRMTMDVDLKTPQTATNATGDTKINGQGFNLEAGYSHKLTSGFVVEPQLQLTHTKVELDDFSSSDEIYNLSDIDGKVTTLRAGLSVYKVFETANGSITPLASVSYLNTLHGKTGLASNDLDFDSDISGSGYKAEIGLLGRYHAWDFAGKIGVSNTSATGSILQPNLTVRRSFGGAAKAQSAAAPQLPEVTEATVKFAEAGNLAVAPLATAASAQDGAPVVSAAYAQTGAEPAEAQEKKEEQPQQTSPELAPEPAAENPMDPAAEPAADVEADEVSDIVVTGTLIRRSTSTDATPITVVTSEDMAERGLMTLGEVMQSFTQNEGFVQGKASNLLGRFTFGAEEINFRGLGAGRTLVLVNGRRIADYPLPFGGEQNGVDLGTIPYSAIAKVEYLSAGASATYGSDAVGGVVNIITKRDMEQTSIELTGGLYQQGFGETGRIAAITGNSFERGSFTIGAEGYYSGEILASDAKYFRKNAPYNAGMIDILENTANGQASVVPQSACAPLGFKFDTTQCVSNVSDTISLNPKVKQGSAFFDGRYDLTDRIELFATAMGSIGQSESRSNVLFWQGVVGNDDNSAAQFITRGFSEDELGISKVTVDNNMWTVVAGAKGGIDVNGGTWYWDVAASHASFHTKQTGINLKEEGVKNWILNGATTVTDSPDQRYTYFVDPDFYNNQLVDNIVRPVQPSDVDALIGKNIMKANSSAQSLTATLNGTFGDLGFLYKPVKFAVRAEYGRQVTEINPDDRTLNTTGEGWFNIGAIEAKGKRSRWAAAAEVDASVLSNLDVVLAGRYDHYDDDSSINGRFTGQAKFLYRPTDWLKVRGGYGQTFRAPDMFNIYGRSDGFETVPDFSAPGCFDGSTYVCGGYQIATTRQADPNLKEEHGDDLGLGVIVNPLPGFQFTVDWYNIHIKDLVLTESAYELLLKEWQCANGALDGSSALCADVNSRVIRNGFDALERVIVQPINSSNLTRSGIDIQASYGFESEKLGAFNFNLGYSRTLKFELTRFKGDDPIDLKYGEPGSATPGNNLNFGVNWYQPLTTGKGIAAGLFVQRTGRVYNFDQSQFLEPFYDVNLSAAYQLNAKTSFRLNVNNVLNTKPQENGSGFWPGYWAHLQTANALGRSAYVSLNYSFN